MAPAADLDCDPTCEPFEPVRCDVFITECTFGLPIYRWRPQHEVFVELNAWWRRNQAMERTSLVLAYSLGKSQRVLAGLDATIGPIAAHGAPGKFVPAYREAGVPMPDVLHVNAETIKTIKGRGLVVAPPSALNTPWLRKLGEVSTAFASGWMQVRGARRWRGVDRGFVLSDHADWEGLLAAVEATGAKRIGVTHGFVAPFMRFLREERGLDAFAIKTEYEGDEAIEAGSEGEDAKPQASAVATGEKGAQEADREPECD